jgi:aspartyl protease family protein
MLFWLVVLLAALTALFFSLSGGEAFSQLEGGEIAYVGVLGALALIYMLSLANDYRGRGRAAFGQILAWAGIFLLLVTGYAYRDDLKGVVNKVAGEVLPAGSAVSMAGGEDGERAVRLRKHVSGHFVARSSVNGANIEMLVDTGASNVVLKPADAEKAGINTADLSFTVPVSTANGQTFAAPIRLKSIKIGDIELTDIEALVAKPGNLNESLLGMSFLRRLRSYEFTGDFLTLRG